jgi:hypothetical protein
MYRSLEILAELRREMADHAKANSDAVVIVQTRLTLGSEHLK